MKPIEQWRYVAVDVEDSAATEFGDWRDLRDYAVEDAAAALSADPPFDGVYIECRVLVVQGVYHDGTLSAATDGAPS